VRMIKWMIKAHPIERRKAFVQQVPSRPVLAAHVSGVVQPVRS
jgi:hypothetical protein